MSNDNPPVSRIAEYLDLQAQKLRIDLKAARLFVTPTDIGSIAEHAVRRFLRSILPDRYAISVGEAIAPSGDSPRRIDQSQQKDVIVHDSHGCAAFGWEDGGLSLFPVESIYAVIEVKTSVTSRKQLSQAVDQAVEVRQICNLYGRGEGPPPFTGVFIFDAEVSGDTLFELLTAMPCEKRPDIVVILQPKSGDAKSEHNSYYFAHWHYEQLGGPGPISFASAHDAANEARGEGKRHKLLTFCDTERALLWLYIFLIQELDSMRLARPDLLEYAGADRTRLGWRNNE